MSDNKPKKKTSFEIQMLENSLNGIKKPCIKEEYKVSSKKKKKVKFPSPSPFKR